MKAFDIAAEFGKTEPTQPLCLSVCLSVCINDYFPSVVTSHSGVLCSEKPLPSATTLALPKFLGILQRKEILPGEAADDISAAIKSYKDARYSAGVSKCVELHFGADRCDTIEITINTGCGMTSSQNTNKSLSIGLYQITFFCVQFTWGSLALTPLLHYAMQ